MAELRWTLLGLGALFVLGLILWEYARKRRATSNRNEPGAYALPPNEPASRAAADASGAESAAVLQRLRDTRGEQPLDELPIIDIEVVADPASADLAANDRWDDPEGAFEVVTRPERRQGLRVESMSAPPHMVGKEMVGSEVVGKAEQWIAAAGMRPLGADDLKLEWPADDQRSIVALRVQARGTERLSGRNLRHALLGEGFIFGKLDLFHLPLADGRVIVSAASLTNPGGFALSGMDAQLFLGLNLFAVLPGPVPPREVLERLVASGRLLAQRLRADVLDSYGQPLTEARLAGMRDRLSV